MIQVYPISWNAKHIDPFGDTIFPGGECHWQVVPSRVRGADLVIDARLSTNDEFMKLLVVADALRGCKPRRLSLFIPYFPGARQDRREPGGALTVKIYADIINRLKFDNVIVVDPHSEVLPALLNNVTVVSPWTLFNFFFAEITDFCGVPQYIIAPDRGATKRAASIASLFQVPVISADKMRDPETGKLSGFRIDPLPERGRYLIVDDICDGGGTFLGLKEAFQRDPNATGSSVSLYVTHGIFSQGLRLLNRDFEKVVTTNSRGGLIPVAWDSWVNDKNRLLNLDHFWAKISLDLTT